MGVDHRFELTAVYSDTGLPARLAPGTHYTAVITVTPSGPVIEDTWALYGWDEAADRWSPSGITSTLDITANVVTAQVTHLSRFAILGETWRMFLPAILRGP